MAFIHQPPKIKIDKRYPNDYVKVFYVRMYVKRLGKYQTYQATLESDKMAKDETDCLQYIPQELEKTPGNIIMNQAHDMTFAERLRFNERRKGEVMDRRLNEAKEIEDTIAKYEKKAGIKTKKGGPIVKKGAHPKQKRKKKLTRN